MGGGQPRAMLAPDASVGKAEKRYIQTLFPRIELLHLLPRNSLAFLRVRCGDTIGEVLLLNAEGKTSSLVIAEHFAQLRVLVGERKQSVFEACVIGDDRSPLISLIKIYLDRFMRKKASVIIGVICEIPNGRTRIGQRIVY